MYMYICIWNSAVAVNGDVRILGAASGIVYIGHTGHDMCVCEKLRILILIQLLIQIQIQILLLLLLLIIIIIIIITIAFLRRRRTLGQMGFRSSESEDLAGLE